MALSLSAVKQTAFSLTALILLFTLFLHLHSVSFHSPPPPSATATSKFVPPFNFTISSRNTSSSLHVHGTCHKPFTYLGVTSNPYTSTFNSHFHVVAIVKSPTPASSILAAEVVLHRCMNATSWLVQSNENAYIHSMALTRKRLAKIPADRHVIVHAGKQEVDADGMMAWRASAKSQRLLQQWYDASEKLDSQKTLMNLFHANLDAFVQRLNGFLGWSLNSVNNERKCNEELAQIGRAFTAGYGLAFTNSMRVIALVLVLSVVMSNYPEGEQLDESYTLPMNNENTSTTEQENENEDVNSKSFASKPSSPALQFLFSLRDTYARIFVKTTQPMLYFVILVMSVALFLVLQASGQQKTPMAFSIGEYAHLLPDGRVLISLAEWIDVGLRIGAPNTTRYTIFHWIANHERIHKGVFVLAEMLEWSGILWWYMALVFVRWGLNCMGRNLGGKGRERYGQSQRKGKGRAGREGQMDPAGGRKSNRGWFWFKRRNLV